MLTSHTDPDGGRFGHYYEVPGDGRYGPWRLKHDNSPAMKEAAWLMAEGGVRMGGGWYATTEHVDYPRQLVVVGIRTRQAVLVEGARPEDVRGALIGLNCAEQRAWREQQQREQTNV